MGKERGTQCVEGDLCGIFVIGFPNGWMLVIYQNRENEEQNA